MDLSRAIREAEDKLKRQEENVATTKELIAAMKRIQGEAPKEPKK